MLQEQVYGEYVEHHVIDKEGENNKQKNKPRHLSKRQSEIIFIILMLALPILQFVLFWLIPNFNSILMGFQKANGEFTIDNFARFFEKLTFRDELTGQFDEIVYAIKNSLIYFAVNIFICTPLVVFFSYVLFRKIPFAGAFKVIFYLPSIIGTTVTATLFRTFFIEGGPGMTLLKNLGWISESIELTGLFENDSTAFLMVIIYSIWTCVGINMIMFYGAMRRIPTEIFESADIDGAGFFKQFIHLVVPLIWPTISTLIIFSLSGMFVTYGAVMILAPEFKSASMLGWYIVRYTTATDSHASLYYPAAVGLIFTAVGLPFVLLVRFFLNKISKNVEY